MRAPLSWLQSLTPLPVDATDRAAVAELASELDALGLVVEGVERVGEGLGDVIVSRVLEIAAIPGADRIRRVVVDTGAADPVEVVCGAWNFVAGDIVPLAPVGAVLPGGFRMERRKMKGVVSNGMICSARELGLGDDHEGILVLGSAGADGPLPERHRARPDPRRAPRHTADVVFDLSIEPNRPDCLCMLGVARDLSARFKLPLFTPEPVIAEGAPACGRASPRWPWQSPELCFRFTGRVLTGLVPVPSPMVVQRRLTLAGMRPISAVVDASNYVMLELGQPTHPYDLDRLGGRGLLARAAVPGETIVTLDGETRTLGNRAARPEDPLCGARLPHLHGGRRTGRNRWGDGRSVERGRHLHVQRPAGGGLVPRRVRRANGPDCRIADGGIRTLRARRRPRRRRARRRHGCASWSCKRPNRPA